MSEEKLLEMWQNITGYVEDWEAKFSEILDELENLSYVREEDETEYEDYENYDEEESNVEDLIEEVKSVRSNLRETVKQALTGEASAVDVEEVFRTTGEFLREVEEKIVKMWEKEEYGDIEDEEDYYDEEDYS